jgi:hypothetical protein
VSRAVTIGIAAWATASVGLGALALRRWWKKDHGSDPCALAPLSYADRDRRYGRPGFTKVANDADGAVVLEPSWASENLESVYVPELEALAKKGVTGAPKNGKLTVNKKVASDLLAFFSDLGKQNLLDSITSFGGAFNARLVRGSESELSSHALGIALDLNTVENPFGKAPAPEGSKGAMQEIARVGKRHGFRWGGCFKRPDGMHLEHGDT